ncbi:MAG: phytanoyl-CoA dioxygenase family protein [Myxococcales bacterium]|nr:phytanoyl-CoA dioxygenase family protein [Myxococcales bacterium]MCB9643524.1 phytanoyl-CoA dioxygenase family protein [Myxococcales bacterium]
MAHQSPQKILSTEQENAFQRDGFLILRGFASPQEVQMLREIAESALDPVIGPAEFEADVRYPGAPTSREAQGGDTPRRLLNALARDLRVRQWATQAAIGKALQSFFGGKIAFLSQCHHNCFMTKSPGFSSQTRWHQDIRYWSFAKPELISFWLALGEEIEENGGLSLIPQSHRQAFTAHQLDAMKFLRDDIEDNQPLIDSAIQTSLQPGDLMFFHSCTFHAAGANLTQERKISLVFTAHAADNLPTPGTRSAQYPSLPFESSQI